MWRHQPTFSEGGWETCAGCQLIRLLLLAVSGCLVVCVASAGTSSVGGSEFTAVLIKILTPVSQFTGEVDH